MRRRRMSKNPVKFNRNEDGNGENVCVTLEESSSSLVAGVQMVVALPENIIEKRCIILGKIGKKRMGKSSVSFS